jgi:glyoxylase-like metal-dependent hydrolase (beta-lactamase superfamily II)
VGSVPQTIAQIKAQIDTAKSPETKAALQRRLKVQEQYKLATDVIRPTPPNVTLKDKMTLFRGGREIEILYLGRAHTAGDVVVYLPQQKILIGGDVVSTQTSNLGDAYAGDWPQTLENLKKLDFDVVLPGHGPAFTDKARIDWWEEYLKDFWTQVQAMKKQGVSVDDAAKRIDMRKHAAHYPNITSVGVDRDAVLGAYEVLDGTR